MQFKILKAQSMVIITVYCVCLIYAWEYIMNIFERMHFRCMTFSAMPLHKDPASGVMKFWGTLYIISLGTVVLKPKNNFFENCMILNSKESNSSKDALCQLWWKWAHWKWSRRFKNFVNIHVLCYFIIIASWKKTWPLH